MIGSGSTPSTCGERFARGLEQRAGGGADIEQRAGRGRVPAQTLDPFPVGGATVRELGVLDRVIDDPERRDTVGQRG